VCVWGGGGWGQGGRYRKRGGVADREQVGSRRVAGESWRQGSTPRRAQQAHPAPSLRCLAWPGLLHRPRRPLRTCGRSLMLSAEPIWKGKLNSCCCWGDMNTSSPSRTIMKPAAAGQEAGRQAGVEAKGWEGGVYKMARAWSRLRSAGQRARHQARDKQAGRQRNRHHRRVPPLSPFIGRTRVPQV
jgi:hypothetical protein